MKYFTFLLGLLLFTACSPSIYQTSTKNYKQKTKEIGKALQSIPPQQIGDHQVTIIESQNFDIRKPSLVVLHHTAQDSCQQTYRTFALDRTSVSSHYVVCEDGTITQMLNDKLRGWHAGNGSWKGFNDLNSISLGIEIDNNGSEPFAEAQIVALMELLGRLKETYNIPTANFIGHADLAPGRKVDPSKYFPWARLAENGFGIWYAEEQLDTVEVPDHFNAEKALQFIGYNTSNIASAIQSFQLHFNPSALEQDLAEKQESENAFTETDKKILWLLVNQ